MYREEVTNNTLFDFDLQLVQNFEPTKEFPVNDGYVTDLSLSQDGLEMLLAADDDLIIYYNMTDGHVIRNVDSKKYGVKLLQYVKNANCIHSSTRVDHAIRYLSLHESKYIRYFFGHTEEVNCIQTCNSAGSNQFVSSSYDKTIRFWDLRSASTTGFLHIPHVPIVAYDPEGIIFAVGYGNDTISLFDVRSVDIGPFKKFKIQFALSGGHWDHLEFSPCGKLIIISTTGSDVLVVDAFTGVLKFVFVSHRHPQKLTVRGTVTPDSKHIVVGQSNRGINFYSAIDGSLSYHMPTTHMEGPHLITFGKSYLWMASVSRRMILWGAPEEYLDEAIKKQKS